MKLNLSTASNLSPNFFLPSKDHFCAKGLLLQQKALSYLRTLDLSKPPDRIFQRVWKVLPYISTMVYRAIACIFPFVSYYWKGHFQALDLLQKRCLLKEHEKKLLSEFFLALKNTPKLFFILRAFASTEQYKTLLFLQGLLEKGDKSVLTQKIDHISEGIIKPLTAEEIGMIEFSPMRVEFLDYLHNQNIEGIETLLLFWKEIQGLQKHPVIQMLKERTLNLFSEGCLGFVSSYEDDKRMEFNLKEDSMRLMSLATILYYLFVGNFCHVGFAFAKDKKVYISDISLHHKHKHIVRPSLMDILSPSHYLYRFTIKPLLSSNVSFQHVRSLEKFFLETLTKKVSEERQIRLDGALAALQAVFLGRKTPFLDSKIGIDFQAKELCTGVTAKSLMQVLLDTKQKMQELGYRSEEITLPFLPHEHLGRMMVSDLIGRLQKRGMIQPVEDPVLKACIEPSRVEAELPFMKTYTS
jgi:hypothetical protein